MKKRSLGIGFVLALATLALPSVALADPIPLGQVGSAGSGAGELAVPEGIAIDDAGNLYVGEVANRRISVFDPNGEFVHAFGRGVQTGADAFEVCTDDATGCQPGSGSGADAVARPFALAVDPTGNNLYVTGSGGVSVFADPAGLSGLPMFSHSFGSSGGGAGQLDSPEGLALDASGNLHVADNANHRISVFADPAGAHSFIHAFGWGVVPGDPNEFRVCTTMCQAGTQGGGAGQLTFPVAVLAIEDPGGPDKLLVADYSNRRVSVFDSPAGSVAFDRAFGWDVEPGGAAEFEFCTPPPGPGCQAGSLGGAAGQIGSPMGLAGDLGSVYVAEDSNRRISLIATTGAPAFTRAFGWGVDTGATAFQVCTVMTGCQAGSSGHGAGQLDFPRSLALDATGNVLVTEPNSDRVQCFGEGPLPPALCGPYQPTVIAGPATSVGLTSATLNGTVNAEGNDAGCEFQYVDHAQFLIDGFASATTVNCVPDPVTGAAATAVSAAIGGLTLGTRYHSRVVATNLVSTSTGTDSQFTTLSPAAAPPSNDFDFGKLKRKKEKGIAFLFVTVPGPGEVGLKGKGLKKFGLAASSVRKSISTAGGRVKLKIKPGKGKKAKRLRQRLRDKGKAKVKVRVTYVPAGGTANTRTKKVKLIRKR